jgi:hypothetical protein
MSFLTFPDRCAGITRPPAIEGLTRIGAVARAPGWPAAQSLHRYRAQRQRRSHGRSAAGLAEGWRDRPDPRRRSRLTDLALNPASRKPCATACGFTGSELRKTSWRTRWGPGLDNAERLPVDAAVDAPGTSLQEDTTAPRGTATSVAMF